MGGGALNGAIEVFIYRTFSLQVLPVFPSQVTGKPAAVPPVSLSHSWHASAGHLHPPVDSPQIDSLRKLLSLSCALTHEVCTAFPPSAAWNA